MTGPQVNYGVYMTGLQVNYGVYMTGPQVKLWSIHDWASS